MEKIPSLCPYCGIGCRLNYVVENGEIVNIEGVLEDNVSEGKPCVKGLTVHETVDEGRHKSPKIRKNGQLEKAAWEEALEFIHKNMNDCSPEEVFFTMSGKIPNEDNYALQKFGRACFRTNNIDSCCGRLCHAATVEGMDDCFGAANLTRMDKVEDIDCLFVIGSNPAENYPVFFNKLMKGKGEVKVISVESILNKTFEQSDVRVVLKPGSEVAFLNGIINQLIKTGSFDEEVKDIEGFERMKTVAEDYSKEYVCEECDIEEESFEKVVKALKNSKNPGVFHGMSFTQHVNSIENVHSLLNLMILKQAEILTLRGELNVQGVGDIGCLPTSLPTGPLPTSEKLEEIWECEVSDEKGKNIMEALLLSPVKAAFIVGFNPAQSMPNSDEVRKKLEEMFLVCADSYSNATSEHADVILPTPIIPERNGTITNGERRVRKVNKVREPLGDSKPEWEIVKELSAHFGREDLFQYQNEREITEEIIEVVPDYRKLNADKIYRGKDDFAAQEKKYERFQPEHFPGVDDVRSEKYPFILTTFRSAYQFLTGEMSSKSERLNDLDEGPVFYVNEEDGKKLGLVDGDEIRVVSSAGSLEAPVKTTEKVPEKVVGATFHHQDLLINRLVPTQFDQESFTPNYKAVAVNLEVI